MLLTPVAGGGRQPEGPVSTRELSLGALLRRYRVTAGLSQEALAERAGLSVRGLSDIARSPNAKLVLVPADMSGVAGALAGLAEIARGALAESERAEEARAETRRQRAAGPAGAPRPGPPAPSVPNA